MSSAPINSVRTVMRQVRALQGWWMLAQADVSPVEAYRRMMSRKGFQFPTLEKMRFDGPKQVPPLGAKQFSSKSRMK